MRILLLTRSYPRDGDLYQYPFVHRRVLAYRQAGHDIRVVRLGNTQDSYEFEGVECRIMSADSFARHAEAWNPDVIAVHGLDEHIWPAIAGLAGRRTICAWLHGSEIPAFFRDKAMRISDGGQRSTELQRVSVRARFWQETLSHWPEGLSLAFVSRYSIDLMRQDVGDLLQDDRITVVHNPIETDLFRYAPKAANDRFSVLSIRPYASPSYGNDLAVKAVLALADHPEFSRSQFTFVGDGPMFEDVLAPLVSLPNVTIKKQFLRQTEVAELHKSHGVFLVPTRLDTQGVSRDEAMASGLVPVTNAVCSIPEFVDDSCGMLAGPEDVDALARGMVRLFEDPGLFTRLSENAARRVEQQSSSHVVIPQELAWMASRGRGAS